MNVSNCKKWIKKNKNSYVDECNEYDLTGIAEGLAMTYNLYIDDMIPDEVFELVSDSVPTNNY